MDPQVQAKLVLVAVIAAGAALIFRQVARSGVGWRVWSFFVITRLYCGIVFHWRSNRRCTFPAEGPGLIVANHKSPVDPLFLWMNHHLSSPHRRIRVLSFLMAREYYEIPGLRWIAVTMRSIPVDRDGKDVGPVRAAYRRLQQGDLIGVFPEGRLNPGRFLGRADTGVAWLALKARVTVFPAYIHGSPKGKTMVEPFYTPSRVRIVYGDPIDLSVYYGRPKTPEVLAEVTDLLMTRLSELGGVPYIPDAPAPQYAGEPAATAAVSQAAGS